MDFNTDFLHKDSTPSEQNNSQKTSSPQLSSSGDEEGNTSNNVQELQNHGFSLKDFSSLSNRNTPTANTNPIVSMQNMQFPTTPLSQAAFFPPQTKEQLQWNFNQFNNPLLALLSTPMVSHPKMTAIPQTPMMAMPGATQRYDEVIDQLVSKNSIREEYLDVTPFIMMSQEEAAKKLNIPSSTLSKRWREATMNRKWPYRNLCKLDREIKTILANFQNGKKDPEMEATLGFLLKKREEETRTVYIKKSPAK